MRLKVSKNAALERLMANLNSGYQLTDDIFSDYSTKKENNTFDEKADPEKYYSWVNNWLKDTDITLQDIFPTRMESHLLRQKFSVTAADFIGTNSSVATLVYQKLPVYINRVHEILDRHLNRYSDLPIGNRMFVEDIDSFIKVRDVNPSIVSASLKKGRIELAEDEVQIALESILDVPFHKKDWGGETNDLYTSNTIINNVRRPTAFLLKGNGLKSAEMTIANCGKNGDQIVRLFQCPAELFVIQYVGPISEAVIHDCEEKTSLRRAEGKNANYLIMDGQDTARLLYAYGKLE
ncbi:MAG: hypothetical protein K9L79_10435 [Methylobacter tundripaludum]|nr:hypothetical protein [Methylobacter tundripaludum]